MTVLMVTGAYYPEQSGAGLQCRALIQACGDRVRFRVLTTAVDRTLPGADTIDGIPVTRVAISPTSRLVRASALPRWIAAAIRTIAGADIVHLHGFSAKSRFVVTIARLMRKRIVIKLTSVGHDDAAAMRSKGGATFRSFRRADRFVGVSPRFAELHVAAGLPPRSLTVIPNGVDLNRFRPADGAERIAIRRDLGLAVDRPLVLFVGFFSREKRPEVVFRAWTETLDRGLESTLVLVGCTRSPYYEIDPALAAAIRSEAARRNCSGRLVMIERSDAIERFYRAADVLMLPSTREGLPNVVLEAMACAVPCIVSRLPGVTDSLIDDEVSGLLVDPGDAAAYGRALARLLGDEGLRAALAAGARRAAVQRFALSETAASYLELYRELVAESNG